MPAGHEKLQGEIVGATYLGLSVDINVSYGGDPVKETVAITKALADDNRLRIIMMVRDKTACVCQIVEVLGNAPSTVSKHLSILKGAGLIDSYKQGRWIYYHLPKQPTKAVEGALNWVIDSLKDSEVIKQDSLKGTVVCEQDPQEITKSQRKR